MPVHKKSEFSSEDQRLSSIAQALSHPARVTILRILTQNPGSTVTELVDILPLAQPTISRHLKELQSAGLISYTNDGKFSRFTIEQGAWDNEVRAFEAFFKNALLNTF